MTPVGYEQANGSLNADQIAQVPNAASFLSGNVRLRTGDLDNNGAVDLLLSRVDTRTDGLQASLIWLQNEGGKFELLQQKSQSRATFDMSDVGGVGRLDLLGLTTDGRAIRAVNHGTKDYHWQTIRPVRDRRQEISASTPSGSGARSRSDRGCLCKSRR